MIFFCLPLLGEEFKWNASALYSGQSKRWKSWEVEEKRKRIRRIKNRKMRKNRKICNQNSRLRSKLRAIRWWLFPYKNVWISNKTLRMYWVNWNSNRLMKLQRRKRKVIASQRIKFRTFTDQEIQESNNRPIMELKSLHLKANWNWIPILLMTLHRSQICTNDENRLSNKS